MNTDHTSDADILDECLARLAFDLNTSLGAGDYKVLGRIGALPERDMINVLAASNECAMLFLKLALLGAVQ